MQFLGEAKKRWMKKEIVGENGKKNKKVLESFRFLLDCSRVMVFS